jgi:hypothetical protein
MPENDVDLAAHGILDIPMSNESGIAFLDEMVKVRDERIEALLAVIARADDFLANRGDMIAAHIVLYEALHPDAGDKAEAPR